jgi:diguanylate cyclase (GGDEF)-like protein
MQLPHQNDAADKTRGTSMSEHFDSRRSLFAGRFHIEVLAWATVTLVAWAIAANFHVFDILVALTRVYEGWPIGDLAVLILFTSISAFIASLLQSQRHLRFRRRAEQDAFAAARRDVLTGLPNRRMLSEATSQAIRDALGRGSKCSILFIDLDGFKPINDTFGHAAGDKVLTSVAERLSEIAPPGATVARLGGDEFAMLLPATGTEDDVICLAQRALQRISVPIEAAGQSVAVAASIGIASGPDVGRRADDLIHAADLAMYSAKRAGRSAIRIYRASTEQV